jgi:hypothetical protein
MMVGGVGMGDAYWISYLSPRRLKSTSIIAFVISFIYITSIHICLKNRMYIYYVGVTVDLYIIGFELPQN